MVGADGQHGHLAVRHHSPPAVFVGAGIPATFSKHSAVAETSVSYGWRNSGRRSQKLRECYWVIMTPNVITADWPGFNVPRSNSSGPLTPFAGAVATVPMVVAAGPVVVYVVYAGVVSNTRTEVAGAVPTFVTVIR